MAKQQYAPSSIYGKTGKPIPGTPLMVFASKGIPLNADNTMRCYKVLVKDASGLWMYWFNGFYGPDGQCLVGGAHDFSKSRRTIESTGEFLEYCSGLRVHSPLSKLLPEDFPPQVTLSKINVDADGLQQWDKDK